MTKSAKLLKKAQEHSGSLRFTKFETLMRQAGWKLHHQRGSHRIWLSKNGLRLPVQEKTGNAKSYQVKQFLKQYEKEV